MNFIYDILVNFQEDLYDFYEWNSNDVITHIRKVPLFVVPKDDFQTMATSIFQVERSFLDKIEKKTEVFTSRDVEYIYYSAVFSDGDDCICFQFNVDGVVKHSSKLLVDESDEVLEMTEKISMEIIPYCIIQVKDVICHITRSQKEQADYLFKELKRLDKQNDVEKLKYLYFECFDCQNENKNSIVKRFKDCIRSKDESVLDIMFHFFKLISIHH